MHSIIWLVGWVHPWVRAAQFRGFIPSSESAPVADMQDWDFSSVVLTHSCPKHLTEGLAQGLGLTLSLLHPLQGLGRTLRLGFNLR